MDNEEKARKVLVMDWMIKAVERKSSHGIVRLLEWGYWKSGRVER